LNTLTLKGNWNVVKGKFKQKLANLMDDDFRYKEGKEEELLGHIQIAAASPPRLAKLLVGTERPEN